MSRGGWFGGRASKNDRFSVHELERLDVVLKNSLEKEKDRDKGDIVEALRCIAENLIWGDQNNPQLFEFFLERKMMRHFYTFIHRPPGGKTNEYAKQALQTLGMLIQNVKNEQSLYFLFSNNFINDIIKEQYDFQDEEVLGYYITFIKAISLKLNDSTVQFFVQGGVERPTQAAGTTGPPTFPLFTEAVKFASHGESMVRAAVRTLALMVFRLRDPAVERFLLGPAGVQYAISLGTTLQDRVQVLDRALWRAYAKGKLQDSATEECLAELEDLICFVNDVLEEAADPVALMVCESIWEQIAGPVLLWPLVSNIPSPPSLVRVPKGLPCVRPLCSLYTMERFFHTVTNTRFINALAGALLLGSHPVTWLVLKRHDAGRMLAPASPRNAAGRLNVNFTHYSNILEDESGNAVPSREYFQGMMYLLQTDDPGMMFVRAAVLRCLIALVRNASIDPDLLDCSRMLPQRLKKTREMIEMMCQSSGHAGGDAMTIYSGLGSEVRSLIMRNSSNGTSYGYNLTESGREGPPSVSSRITPIHARSESSTSLDVDGLLGAVVHMHLDGSRPGGSIGKGSGARSVLEAELEDGPESISIPDELVRVLLNPDVPPLILSMIGWLLRQLLPASRNGRGPSVLGSTRRRELEKAVVACQDTVRGELEGSFADSVPLFTHQAWPPWRQRLVNPNLPTTPESLLWPIVCGRPGKGGLSPGAKGVQATAERVQRLVVVAQVYQLLNYGRVALEAPIRGNSIIPRLRYKEGSTIRAPENSIQGRVSFQPNQLTAVRFHVQGETVEPGPLADEPPLIMLLSGAVNSLGEAEVVSTAPLLGSKLAVDPKRAQWLHVHVRAPLRNLARAGHGGFDSAVGKVVLKPDYLIEGHWVLAMTDGDAAQAAIRRVDDATASILQRCSELMEPLMSMSEFVKWGPGQSKRRRGAEDRGAAQIRIEGSIATGEGGAEDSRGISGSDVRTPPRRRNPDAAESSIPEEDEGDVEAP